MGSSKKTKDSVAFATEPLIFETLLKYYLRLTYEECLVLLSPAFCPISLNLSANLSWSVTGCDYLNSLGMWSLYGHSERQKVRKYESYTPKKIWSLASYHTQEKLPRYCPNIS